MTFNKPLRIGEIFLSIQGEGSTAGQLSIFVRTTGCTLNCTWCDSATVWKKKGIPYTPQELVTYLRSTFETPLVRGARLILTGGSPLMQQDRLTEFLSLFSAVKPFPLVEVETEGVLIPSKEFDPYIHQYNVSPKLSNSGMAKEKRYNVDTLKWHAHSPAHLRSIFKFVVSSLADVREVEDVQFDIGIPSNRIWLMPLASTKEDYEKMAPTVARMATAEGYNFSPRLHIQLWDQTTGV